MQNGFSADQIEKLEADLSADRVKQRQGAGSRTFSHIEGWDAIRQANEVFGFDGWARELIELREVWAGQKPGYQGKPPKDAVAYVARVRITVYAGERVVIREGVGFGNGEGPNLGDAHELAAKEAETDAMKRALSTFGWGFGLALYDKQQRHVSDGEGDGGERAGEQSQSAPDPFADGPPPRAHGSRAQSTPTATARNPRAKGEPKTDAPEPKRVEDDAEGFKVVRLAPPKDRSEAGWRDWSRPLLAAIKASGSRREAVAQIKANVDALRMSAKDTGKDALAMLGELVDKRWPKPEAAETAEATQAAPATERPALAPKFVVALPKTHTKTTLAAWADKLRDVIISEAQDMSEVDHILEGNADGVNVASATLESDVGEAIRGMWTRAQKRGKAR